jgi:hypothetical protein
MGGTIGVRRRRRSVRAAALLGMAVLLAIGTRAHAADGPGRIERIELGGDAAAPTVVVTTSRPLAYDVKVLDGDATKRSGRRLVLDFANATLAPEAARPVAGTSALLRQVRPGQFDKTTARIVLDVADDATHSVAASASASQVTIALAGPGATGAAVSPPPSEAAAVAVPAPAAAAVPPPAVAVAPEAAPPPPATTVASDAPKQPVRNIPIRARGRRPYSLNYSR